MGGGTHSMNERKGKEKPGISGRAKNCDVLQTDEFKVIVANSTGIPSAVLCCGALVCVWNK